MSGERRNRRQIFHPSSGLSTTRNTAVKKGDSAAHLRTLSAITAYCQYPRVYHTNPPTESKNEHAKSRGQQSRDMERMEGHGENLTCAVFEGIGEPEYRGCWHVHHRPTRNASTAPRTEPVQASSVPNQKPSVAPAKRTKRAPGRKSTVRVACMDVNASRRRPTFNVSIHARMLLKRVVVGSQKPKAMKQQTRGTHAHRRIKGQAVDTLQWANTSHLRDQPGGHE